MAKVKRSLIEVYGKVGDQVIVHTKKGDRIMRKAPKTGSKRNEPAFKKQFARTKLMNKISSEVNSIMDKYNGAFKSKNFYRALQKLLRKEPLDNRFLLLKQLKGMEINPSYPSDKDCHIIDINRKGKKLIVNLKVRMHVSRKKLDFNCYYYQLVLLVWNKSKKAPKHADLLSVWISEGRPEFEFELPTPEGTTNWLLCLRQILGMKNEKGVEKEIGTYPAECMYIVDAGTFDKKEQAILDKRNKEIAERPRSVKKAVDTRVRVKPKRIN